MRCERIVGESHLLGHLLRAGTLFARENFNPHPQEKKSYTEPGLAMLLGPILRPRLDPLEKTSHIRSPFFGFHLTMFKT